MAADLALMLPEEVEIGAHRRLDWGTDIVTTDGGWEARNNRWSSPLRVYEITFPHATRDDSVYVAVRDAYEQAQGNLYSFNFTDWTDGQNVVVRFDSPLEMDTPAGEIDHIVGVVLKEVRT